MSELIWDKIRKGGVAVSGAMLFTFVAAGVSIDVVRIGSTLDADNQLHSDFIADILPPALFLVEPMLQASLIGAQPAEAAEHAKALRQLQAAYEQQLAKWRASELEPDLKRLVETRLAPEGAQFWQDVNTRLIPAGLSGNAALVRQEHARILEHYDRHHTLNAELVARAETRAEESRIHSMRVAWTIIAALAAIGIALLVGIRIALRRLNTLAIEPLAQTARTMTEMASGNLDAGRGAQPRADEIGEMRRAIETFRTTALAQRDTEQAQRAVVAALSTGLTALAQGDLEARIVEPLPAEYESLRASFNSSLEQLSGIMAAVAATAGSVNSGASEIRAASDDLALRNEQQAASIEETAAAMNQVTAMVKDNADSAAQAQRTIADAHREATEGGAVVQRATSAMAAIENSAQEITQIIDVIDGIAFQTNLLALNAGVEAARAGDAGKGFAVVANEVRALAQRSADAARDIKELITTSTTQVAGGVQLVGETGQLLGKIVNRVGDISNRMTGIAESNAKQAANLEQVNSAVGDMDRMTQQNAAMVEQSTAAARSLAGEADELTGLVSRFRIGARPSAKVVAHPAASMPRAASAQPAPRRAVNSGKLAVQTATAADADWSKF